jgi:hypothetical protein
VLGPSRRLLCIARPANRNVGELHQLLQMGRNVLKNDLKRRKEREKKNSFCRLCKRQAFLPTRTFQGLTVEALVTDLSSPCQSLRKKGKKKEKRKKREKTSSFTSLLKTLSLSL